MKAKKEERKKVWNYMDLRHEQTKRFGKSIVYNYPLLVLCIICFFFAAFTAVASAEDPRCACGDICVNETGWWQGGGDFNPCGTPIQSAVDNATAGETICVNDGIYNENVDVHKQLTIRSTSGNPEDTIVNASDANDHVFEVTANWVNISGFTVQNATAVLKAGIYLGNGVEHCYISDNNATNNYFGICLWTSDNNDITNNTCNSNGNSGIYLERSNSNTVSDNVCNQNTWEGIWLDQSNNNAISNNAANLNNRGIDLEWQSNDNTVTNNTCNSNNMLGISLLYNNPGNNNFFADNTASDNNDYDFYSHEDAYNNTIKDLSIASYPTTISFTYANGVGLKGVEIAPGDPAGKANISKYVNATDVTANSWIFLNVSYSDADLDGVDENSLRLWRYRGTDWTEVPAPNGVNTIENYVYGNITEFSVFAPLGNFTGAKLEINKTGVPDPVSPGSTLNYSISVNNTGNATATNVTVTETYDENVTFVAAVPAPSSSDDTWQFATLNASDTRWINVSVIVNASVLNGTVLHNIVNVSCDEGVSDSDTENTTVFAIPAIANVKLSKWVKYKTEPESEYRKEIEDAKVCNNVSFKIAVQNNGTGTNLTGISVTDILNCSLGYINDSANIPPTIYEDNCPVNQTLLWQFATVWLEPGEYINITFDAHVDECGHDRNYARVDAISGTGCNVSDEDYVYVNCTAQVCVETATGTGNACFATDSGTIEDLVAVDESTLPEEGKPELVFPHGFFSFNITGLTQGQTIVVTITLPDIVPVGTEYWKYHDSEGGWTRIPMGSDDGDNEITITLVDGGLGDDDGTVNGVIVDQGGPGIPKAPPVITSFAPPSPVNDTVCNWRTFNVTVNQTVNVSWYLNNTRQHTNESTKEASYTLHAEVVGEHNVSAIATNENGTDMQMWVWNVTAAPLPVLEINKTDNPDPVSPSGALNYSIRVNNTGNATATNVTVMETYDENVTFVAAVPVPSLGNDTWQFPTLNASETRWINISVTVNASVLNGTVLHNVVNVTCDEGVMDSDTEDTTVLALPEPPNIISFAPPSPVNDTVCNWRTFNVSVDQTVNVSWYLTGSLLFTNESVREASCRLHADAAGVHNVSAIVSNANGSDMQTWIWNVTKAADLVITDKWLCWPDNCTICYNVKNIGNGTAPACHNTALYVDGVAVAHDHVPVPLAPGESYIGCFGDYSWTYAPPSDNITVCADNNEALDELDEDNNCLTNIWMCGDVNSDGKVTMSDVRKVFNRYLDPNYPLELPWAADVNCDGKVSMSDVRKVFNRYLDPGYELNCCCEGVE